MMLLVSNNVETVLFLSLTKKSYQHKHHDIYQAKLPDCTAQESLDLETGLHKIVRPMIQRQEHLDS